MSFGRRFVCPGPPVGCPVRGCGGAPSGVRVSAPGPSFGSGMLRNIGRVSVLVLTAVAVLGVSTVALATTVPVKKDDNLTALSRSYCGSSDWRSTIYNDAGNRRVIGSNPNLILPGQRLEIDCIGAPRIPAASRSSSRTTSGWVHPLPGGAACVSRWHVWRGDHWHAGLDLSRGRGTPVRAIHAGKVTVRRYQAGGAGNYVVIDHGAGVKSVYMHLLTPASVSVGAHVTAGQQIGVVGATGNATRKVNGAWHSYYHLHFEIRIGSSSWPKDVNPSSFMSARGIKVGC